MFRSRLARFDERLSKRDERRQKNLFALALIISGGLTITALGSVEILAGERILYVMLGVYCASGFSLLAAMVLSNKVRLFFAFDPTEGYRIRPALTAGPIFASLVLPLFFVIPPVLAACIFLESNWLYVKKTSETFTITETYQHKGSLCYRFESLNVGIGAAPNHRFNICGIEHYAGLNWQKGAHKQVNIIIGFFGTYMKRPNVESIDQANR